MTVLTIALPVIPDQRKAEPPVPLLPRESLLELMNWAASLADRLLHE